MREQYYRIADLGIRVAGKAQQFCDEPGILENFLCTPIPAVHSVAFSVTQTLEPPSGKRIYADPAHMVFADGDAVIRYEGTVSQGWDKAYLRLLRNGNSTEAQIKESSVPQGVTPKLIAQAMELEHLLAAHNGIVLHSSYIHYRGKGILFTAPSGTGKSTQAALWEKYKDAELINGDRTAIRSVGENIFAYGIPFAGSSNLRINKKLPLAAIVYLAQAPQTRITRLTGAKAFRSIWEGCTINIWNEQDVELCSQTVLEIANRIPVYYLECTPDLTAVETLHQELERSDAI